ncbi:MAG: hypothetical protein U9N61_08110 [Euryarchaeota archaeon]|nr:hypothetical protein [Euryarchaeota archaeon]
MAIRLLLCLLLLPVLVVGEDDRPLTEVRWLVLDQCHVSTSGTAQISAASTDSIIERGIVQVSVDFPAVINETQIVMTHRVRGYSLPSDWLNLPDESSIRWCLRYKANADTVTTPILSIPGRAVYAATMGVENAPVPQLGDKPSHVWSSGDSLYVWPTPRFPDTLLIEYRAVADSTSDINNAYSEHLINWSCWKVLTKVGRYAEGEVYHLWYENEKAKRGQ